MRETFIIESLFYGLPFSGTRREQFWSLLLYDDDSFSFYWITYSMYYLSLGLNGNSSADFTPYFTGWGQQPTVICVLLAFHSIELLILWITFLWDYTEREQFYGFFPYDDDIPFYLITYSMDYLFMGLDGSSSKVSTHMMTMMVILRSIELLILWITFLWDETGNSSSVNYFMMTIAFPSTKFLILWITFIWFSTATVLQSLPTAFLDDDHSYLFD